MKLKILLLIMLLSPLAMQAQSLKEVVEKIPDSVVLGLTGERLALLLADENADSVNADNEMGGVFVRREWSADFLELQTSKAGIVQIKLLPYVNKTKIVCVVTTVCGGVCDSRMDFYSTDWHTIPSDGLMPQPSLSWFLKEKNISLTDTKKVTSLIDMHPMTFRLSASGQKMTVTSELEGYLNEEDFFDLKPLLRRQTRTLVWNKNKFVLQN